MQWSGEQNFSITNGCRDFYYKADRISYDEYMVTSLLNQFAEDRDSAYRQLSKELDRLEEVDKRLQNSWSGKTVNPDQKTQGKLVLKTFQDYLRLGKHKLTRAFGNGFLAYS